MPVREMQPTDKKMGATRLQIIGPPYGQKTTVAAKLALDGHTTVFNIPGEKHTDILTPNDNLRILLSDPLDDGDGKVDWVQRWVELRAETLKLVGNKTTKPTYSLSKHVVFDGAHKAYELARRAGKMKFATDGFKAWDYTNDEFLRWFEQGIYSPHVEWVIWLAWSAREQVEGEGSKKKTIMPDYMGKMQQTIVGEMNIILQTVEGGVPCWQLRQTDDAQGIGIRTTPEKAEKLPVKIKAQWPELKKILVG